MQPEYKPWTMLRHGPQRPPVAPDRAHDVPHLDDELDVAPLPIHWRARLLLALTVAAWAFLAAVCVLVWPW